MDSLTIMRRANGDLFTLMHKGREHLAVWPTLQSAIHYKERNPELFVFFPASVASPFGQNGLLPLQKENKGLFLLTGNGGAHFQDGHKISWAEIENSLHAGYAGNTAPIFKDAEDVTAVDRFDDDGGNQILLTKGVLRIVGDVIEPRISSGQT